jgi:hypothetical protein
VQVQAIPAPLYEFAHEGLFSKFLAIVVAEGRGAAVVCVRKVFPPTCKLLAVSTREIWITYVLQKFMKGFSFSSYWRVSVPELLYIDMGCFDFKVGFEVVNETHDSLLLRCIFARNVGGKQNEVPRKMLGLLSTCLSDTLSMQLCTLIHRHRCCTPTTTPTRSWISVAS